MRRGRDVFLWPPDGKQFCIKKRIKTVNLSGKDKPFRSRSVELFGEGDRRRKTQKIKKN